MDKEKSFKVTENTELYFNAILKINEATDMVLQATDNICEDHICPDYSEEALAPFQEKLAQLKAEVYRLIQNSVELHFAKLDNIRQEVVSI